MVRRYGLAPAGKLKSGRFLHEHASSRPCWCGFCRWGCRTIWSQLLGCQSELIDIPLGNLAHQHGWNRPVRVVYLPFSEHVARFDDVVRDRILWWFYHVLDPIGGNGDAVSKQPMGGRRLSGELPWRRMYLGLADGCVDVTRRISRMSMEHSTASPYPTVTA